MPQKSQQNQQRIQPPPNEPFLLEGEVVDSPFEGPDSRDSMGYLYLSLIPFLAGEYFFELLVADAPSGIVFPLGFLIFWAFFYTFYQPDSLERKLSNSHTWDIVSLPAILIGVAIWFIKVTLVESLLFLGRLFAPKVKPKPKQKPKPKFRSKVKQPPKPTPLPIEVAQALKILGFQQRPEWKEIQKRYRHLARQYHPDLNGDITKTGHRFMRFDQAYRTLCAVRSVYFK